MDRLSASISVSMSSTKGGMSARIADRSTFALRLKRMLTPESWRLNWAS